VNNARDKWNGIYKDKTLDCQRVTDVLAENAFLLPQQGQALDLACGLGANAVFLARQGLAVTAWDISDLAIAQLQAYASQQGLQINACQQNITPKCFPEARFDVIVVSRFLDRSLMDAIIRALNPNGLLFYQTFTQVSVHIPDSNPRQIPNNPAYLLAENELLQCFSTLSLVVYRENATLGNPRLGLRNEAQLIGRKRPYSG